MPDRLTDEDLREALRLDAEATARPWVARETHAYLREGVVNQGPHNLHTTMRMFDAALVASYRNDYPSAARELLRLREGLREMRNLHEDTEVHDAKACDLLNEWAGNLLAGRTWDGKEAG